MNVLFDLLKLTARSPTHAADQLISMTFKRNDAWMALSAMVLLSVCFLFLVSGGRAMVVAPDAPELGPFVWAILVLGLTVALVFGIQFTGQAMGGTARFADTVAIMAWVQAIQLVIQVLQAVIILTLPSLAGVLTLLLMGGLFWVTLSLLSQLMGFESLGKAGLMLLLAAVGVALALVFVLTILGLLTMGDVG